MTNNNTASVKKEITQIYRTINMLSTIYEKLYYRYRNRARIFDIIILLTSILLCLTTFVDSKILQSLQITPDIGQMILGTSSIIIFAIAITFFIIDWKEKAAKFSQACETLNKMETDCREQLKGEITREPQDLQTKCQVYSTIINNLPQIPEKDFHKLKTFHKRQLELEKMIDLYPGGSVWLLKIFTFFRSNIHVLLRKPMINNNPEDN